MGDTQDRNRLIWMVGADHSTASADVRSAFSLPAEVREAVLSLARVKLGASGVVLLATCNRTELWVSFDGVDAPERAFGPRNPEAAPTTINVPMAFTVRFAAPTA